MLDALILTLTFPCRVMSGSNPLLCLLQGSWAEVKMVTLKEEPSVPASSQHGKVSCLALTLPQWSTFSGSHLLLAQWPCRNCPPWWLSQSPPALLPSAFDLVVLNIDSSTLCSFFLGSLCFQLLFPVHLSSSVHFTL